MEPSKYRPISLLNIGGKVQEELLINRIHHNTHNNELLIDSKYGFTPQNSTTCAAIDEKKFIKPELEKRRVVIMTSLENQRSIQSSVVAKHPKRLERCRMPTKHVLPYSRKVLRKCKRTRKSARSGNGNKTLDTPSTRIRNYS